MTALRIAYYYLVNPSKRLVHRCSLVAFSGIVISTTVLLLALSIFNGLETLVYGLLRTFTPDLCISLKSGKYFSLDPRVIQNIRHTQGVQYVVSSLSDKALLRHGDYNTVVKIKGVTNEFWETKRLNSFIHGELPSTSSGYNWVLLGNGIKNMLSVPLGSTELQALYPNRKISSFQTPYRIAGLHPIGSFSVEQQFDDHYVVVPLCFADHLFNANGKVDAIEVYITPNSSTSKVKASIQQLLPDSFQVHTYYQQQATLLQAINVERFFVVLVFLLIFIVAILNIFFILFILGLHKRQDLFVLHTLGMTRHHLRFIFYNYGFLITLSGTLTGMLIALALCWVQQTFGVVSLGIETSLVDAYPVECHLGDFLYTSLGVCLGTFITSLYPANLAVLGMRNMS